MSTPLCPVCQAKGRRLKPLTVTSLARSEVLARLTVREGFHYCPTADCAVVWYQPETGEVVDKSELKVRVGMKETVDPRPICYCFGHDAAEFEADVSRQGHSDIPAEIAGKCKQGLDRCEEKNPQGACCLGNVNQVVQAAKGKRAPAPAQPFAQVADTACCGVEENEADDGK